MGFTLECSSVCSIGWADDQGKRPEMEDAFVIIDRFADSPNNCFVGIYDGHGGAATSRFLMNNLHRNIKFFLDNPGLDTSDVAEKHGYMQATALIKRAFVFTDDQLIAQGINQSGSTACIILIRKEAKEKILYCAHLGDSRAVLCHNNKDPQRLTSMSDHKASDPIEIEQIERNGGYVYNERVNSRLAVSRAFGDAELKTGPKPAVSNMPDVKCVVLKGDEQFIILACDGLWDVMKDGHAVKFVLEFAEVMREACPTMTCGEAAEVLARALVEEALIYRETTDNVTVVIVLLTPLGFVENSKLTQSQDYMGNFRNRFLF